MIASKSGRQGLSPAFIVHIIGERDRAGIAHFV